MVTVVIPLVRLSVVVFFHTILSTWAMFGGEFLGEGYLFQQLVLVIAGVWALHDRIEPRPAGFYTCLILFSIITDLMCLTVYTKDRNIWEEEDNAVRHHEKFSFAVAVILLFFKPFFTFFAFHDFQRRGGNVSFSISVETDDGESGDGADSAGDYPYQSYQEPADDGSAADKTS